MKNIFTFFALTLTLFMNAQDIANYKKYETANAQLKSSKTQVKTILFGDSITEFWKSNNPSFFEQHQIVNRGISGQTTSQMLLRFRQDVLNLNPKQVVIMAGINDIAENTGPISLEHVADNIFSMVELAKFHHIKVVMSSVLPAYSFSWKAGIEPANKVLELNKMLKAYALKNKIPFIEYHAAMKDTRNGLPAKYSGDEVHPNKEGYDVMEKILLPFLK